MTQEKISCGTMLPRVTDQTLTLKFDAQKGTGEDYVYQNFGIQAKVINAD